MLGGGVGVQILVVGCQTFDLTCTLVQSRLIKPSGSRFIRASLIAGRGSC
jgi:hypothetical protein